ncbi:MAG: phosphopantetheine-binding protein, partial [Rickettsia endosymbiont of Ixodes persulcatus]|nr:phosphopantetheine-binding protein [Rickettsia endosymbiont of Ixodes persulcatus]
MLAEPFGISLRLLGWFAGSASEADVLAALTQSLPDYMVPSSLMRLDAWPLNVNGKVERKALPRTEQRNAVSESVTYADEQEKLICESIAAVTGIEIVRSNDDFFALGCDSISAMALCTALRKAGFVLRPRDVFGLRHASRMKVALQPLETQPQLRM